MKISLLFVVLLILLAHTAPIYAEGLDSWTVRVSGSVTALLADDNGLLARQGDLSLQWNSTDGTNWSQTESLPYVNVWGLASGNGRVVAAGGGVGGGVISTSTNRGASWMLTRPSTFATRSGAYVRAVYGAGTFVVVGSTSPDNQPLLSGDGLTWQPGMDVNGNPFSGPLGPGFSGAAYGGGRFIVVGTGGTIYTSADGTRWSWQNSGTTANLGDVAYGGGRFLVIGDGVTLTSTTGAKWQFLNAPSRGNLTRLAYGAGQFVAVGSGGFIQSTTDGEVWVTRRYSDTGKDYLSPDIVFYRDAFYALQSRGDGVSGVFPGILQSGSVGTLGLTLQLAKPTGQLQLIVRSDPGSIVHVEVSTDLANWQLWSTLTNVTGLSQLSDSYSGTAKFYRAARE